MVENSLHVRQRMVSMTEAWCKLWRWTTQGRASRSEYWFVQLWTFIITTAVEILIGISTALGEPLILTLLMIPISIFLFIVSLLVFLLSIRRLHDTGRSGWWVLISLIPFVGAIILLVFLCMASEPVDNRFGEVPNLVIDEVI